MAQSQEGKLADVFDFNSCLRAIRTLQRFGHLPRETTVLKCYAIEGNFIDVRLAALEALVDFTAGYSFYSLSISKLWY